MSKNDCNYSISFRFNYSRLSHFEISNFIDRVMASVGFYSYEFLSQGCELIESNDSSPQKRWEAYRDAIQKAFSHKEIPTAAFGWPIRSADWWSARKLIDSSRDVSWSSTTRFGGAYQCQAQFIRLFHDLGQKNSNVCPSENLSISSRKFPVQSFVFTKGRRENDEAGQLILMATTMPNPVERCGLGSALVRYWSLTLRDVVLQLHHLLTSSPTSIQREIDSSSVLSLGPSIHPNFWPREFFEFEPSGDPKVDAVLDAYEQELRDDPLRKKVLSQEIPLPESL
jgi:hypothetical protein